MRALIIWQSVYPWEVRIEKLADSLLSMGHDVTVLARHGAGAPAEEVLSSGLRVCRVGAGLPRAMSVPVSPNPVWIRAIAASVTRLEPDLIVARDIPLAEAAGRVGRARGIPVVMDMAEHYPGAMRSWRKHRENPVSRLLVHRLRVPDLFEKRAVRLMDGVITVCEEQNERLHASYGYARDRMRVVNNSPRRAWFSGARKGPSKVPRVFGHHGHMTPERGLDVLLEAFHHVQAEVPDVELHLAGSGETAADVGASIRKLGIEQRVRLTGRYTHADLDRLYGAIDIGVLPYPPNELINHTLSNKIFDYMACGKPVITSAAAPMERLVKQHRRRDDVRPVDARRIGQRDGRGAEAGSRPVLGAGHARVQGHVQLGIGDRPADAVPGIPSQPNAGIAPRWTRMGPQAVARFRAPRTMRWSRLPWASRIQ